METGIRAWPLAQPSLKVTSTTERSPERNLVLAQERLRLELARQVRAPWPPAAGTAAIFGRYRTGQGRLAVNPANPDAAVVLAVVLDAVEAGGGPRAASALLGLTRTQLDDFLGRMDPQTAQRLRKAPASATLAPGPASAESASAPDESDDPDEPTDPGVPDADL